MLPTLHLPTVPLFFVVTIWHSFPARQSSFTSHWKYQRTVKFFCVTVTVHGVASPGVPPVLSREYSPILASVLTGGTLPVTGLTGNTATHPGYRLDWMGTPRKGPGTRGVTPTLLTDTHLWKHNLPSYFERGWQQCSKELPTPQLNFITNVARSTSEGNVFSLFSSWWGRPLFRV